MISDVNGSSSKTIYPRLSFLLDNASSIFWAASTISMNNKHYKKKLGYILCYTSDVRTSDQIFMKTI